MNHPALKVYEKLVPKNATLPRSRYEKFAGFEVSSQVGKVGFQISKCHFSPPPTPVKSWQIWNFQVKLDYKVTL